MLSAENGEVLFSGICVEFMCTDYVISHDEFMGKEWPAESLEAAYVKFASLLDAESKFSFRKSKPADRKEAESHALQVVRVKRAVQAYFLNAFPDIDGSGRRTIGRNWHQYKSFWWRCWDRPRILTKIQKGDDFAYLIGSSTLVPPEGGKTKTNIVRVPFRRSGPTWYWWTSLSNQPDYLGGVLTACFTDCQGYPKRPDFIESIDLKDRFVILGEEKDQNNISLRCSLTKLNVKLFANGDHDANVPEELKKIVRFMQTAYGALEKGDTNGFAENFTAESRASILDQFKRLPPETAAKMLRPYLASDRKLVGVIMSKDLGIVITHSPVGCAPGNVPFWVEFVTLDAEGNPEELTEWHRMSTLKQFILFDPNVRSNFLLPMVEKH